MDEKPAGMKQPPRDPTLRCRRLHGWCDGMATCSDCEEVAAPAAESVAQQDSATFSQSTKSAVPMSGGTPTDVIGAGVEGSGSNPPPQTYTAPVAQQPQPQDECKRWRLDHNCPDCGATVAEQRVAELAAQQPPPEHNYPWPWRRSARLVADSAAE